MCKRDEVRQEQGFDALKIYQTNHNVMLTMLADAIDVSMIHLLTSLHSTETKVRCCSGTREESNDAMESLRSANTIVLDPTALAALFITDRYELLLSSDFDFVISQGCILELRSYLSRDITGMKGSHSLGRDSNGNYSLLEIGEESGRAYRASLLRCLNFLER